MLQDFALITVAAAVALILFRRLKQPAILGYLLTGVLIGPYTLPLSPVGNVESIRLLADVGLVVLLFALGLELGWDRIRRVGLRVVLIGVIEVSLMVVIGYQVGKWLGWTANEAFFLGAAVSISSSAVIVKMLNDTGDLKSIRGRLVVGILVVEDFAAVVLLSALTGIATTGASSPADVGAIVGKLILFVVVALVIGRLFAHRITSILVRFKSAEMLLLGSLGLCFGLALVADELGLSAAAGAFLIGTVLGDTIHAPRITRITSPVRDLLAAIFFVSIGMLANFAELGKYLVPAVVVTSVVVFGKLIATTAGAFLTGHGGQTSVSVGTATTQSGEFSLAMAKVGAEHGVVGPILYPVVTLTTVVTSFTYPFLYRSAPAITRFLERVSPTWLLQYETALSRRIGCAQANHHSEKRRGNSGTSDVAEGTGQPGSHSDPACLGGWRRALHGFDPNSAGIERQRPGADHRRRGRYAVDPAGHHGVARPGPPDGGPDEPDGDLAVGTTRSIPSAGLCQTASALSARRRHHLVGSVDLAPGVRIDVDRQPGPGGVGRHRGGAGDPYRADGHTSAPGTEPDSQANLPRRFDQRRGGTRGRSLPFVARPAFRLNTPQ